MAVRFAQELDVLLDDLGRAGFKVLGIDTIPGSRGRSADVRLENGVIVSWDYYTSMIWAEGTRFSWIVESYLHDLYERRWLPRVVAVQRAHSLVWLRNRADSLALWLLRSSSLGARLLRWQIMVGSAKSPRTPRYS